MFDAEPVGEVDPGERLEVTVMVRPRHSLDEIEARLNQARPGAQPILSREEFAATYGADPHDVARVEEFARAHALDVVESNPAQRRVVLAGSAADLSTVFDVKLARVRDAQGRTYRAPAGVVTIPPELADVVQGVFGLDDRPIARRI